MVKVWMATDTGRKAMAHAPGAVEALFVKGTEPR
jgi:hypothetical protein